MKEIVKTSRLAGQLESLFRKLNEDFFNSQLETPIITIQSTPRAYGHYSTFNAWTVRGEGKREINIGAGTLYRPIENTIATLLHEMCHMYNDTVLNIQDTSRKGEYHNKYFKATAETHGLIITYSERFGWSYTEPADELLTWILENNIQEIKLTRTELDGIQSVGGPSTTNGGTPAKGTPKGNSIRYHCPKCNAIARTTRPTNLICGDCLVPMVTG
jgi:hypothetical protein